MMKKQLFSSVFVNPRTHQWARLLGPSLELEKLLSLSSSSSSYSVGSQLSQSNNNNSAHNLLIAKIKETNESLQTGQRQEWYRIQVGLTQRGLDDIGDISHVERKLPTSRQQKNGCQQQDQHHLMIGPLEEVKRQQEFLKIIHDGHAITAADEMYHTVWDTITEEVSIASPADGWVTSSVSAACHKDEDEDRIARHVDDETILMDMITTKEEVEHVFPLSSSNTMSYPTIRRSSTGDDVGDTGEGSDYHQQLFIHERDYFNLIVPSLPPGKYAEEQL